MVPNDGQSFIGGKLCRSGSDEDNIQRCFLRLRFPVSHDEPLFIVSVLVLSGGLVVVASLVVLERNLLVAADYGDGASWRLLSRWFIGLATGWFGSLSRLEWRLDLMVIYSCVLLTAVSGGVFCGSVMVGFFDNVGGHKPHIIVLGSLGRLVVEVEAYLKRWCASLWSHEIPLRVRSSSFQALLSLSVVVVRQSCRLRCQPLVL
ncbi:unnamed protein product [Arabis nemorensis]|uniref:Uncharacterized protein n=1 Tax=Arabis nemorensis TaxID=586526 RepID=A0A565BI19_9BRAS|nr:unnamed protein product [Arabis nemorensis]